jgi:putative two-component system hydrogenase maturation factor HypX/HoxX
VLTVSAIRGNVGSGGCFLALASDWVLARDGVVLNPHYKNMGNLYGSEYWTYVLPRRMGKDGQKIMARRLPVDAREARELGFLDDVLPAEHAEFANVLRDRVKSFVSSANFEEFLAQKKSRRAVDEARKPLDVYEAEELKHMHRNFYGFDPSYHVARYNFVFKIPHSRTPLHLARHRVQ